MGNGLDSKRLRNGYSGHHLRINSVNNGLNWWSLFGGRPHYLGNKLLATNSGFKRWKDGDATVLQQSNNAGLHEEDLVGDLELVGLSPHQHMNNDLVMPNFAAINCRSCCQGARHLDFRVTSLPSQNYP
jgi:hypothetical protein